MLLFSSHIAMLAITTKFASSNTTHDDVNTIQRYAIKFVSNLRQVGGCLQVCRLPPATELLLT